MTERTLVRQIVILTCCKFLLNTGRRFIYPFASVLSRGLGIDAGAVTSVIALSQFSSLVGICAGPLADRVGLRAMMLTGMGLLVAGLLLCGLPSISLLVLIGLVLANFGKVFFDPAVQAFIGRQVDFAHRARVVGLSEMSWSGSTLVGIPLLGLAFAHLGLRGSFFLLALLGMLAWFALYRTLPKITKTGGAEAGPAALLHGLGPLLRQGKVLAILIFSFCLNCAGDMVFISFGRWFEQDFHVGLVSLGFSTIAIGLAELTGEGATALFSDRIGLRRAILLGLVFMTLACLQLPLIGTSLPWAMAALFCIFCASEFTVVTSFSLCTELVPGARATMMAGFYGAGGLGRALGVLCAPLLWQLGGMRFVCMAAAMCTGLAFVVLLAGLRRWRREDTGAAGGSV